MSVQLNILCLVCINLPMSAEHLLKGCKHFHQSVMVCVAVPKLDKTDLVFVQPSAKINSAYCCDLVLKEGLLLDLAIYQMMTFCFSFCFMLHCHLPVLPCAGVD